MSFLKLHVKGKPALLRLDLINGIIPPLKGPGTLIICGDEDLTLQVDESLEEIEGYLAEYEVEIIDVANDCDA